MFASKNNKAVDVVHTRVNSLGPRPVLLRLGANDYQAQLSDHLTSLLASSATEEDHERYNKYKADHIELLKKSDALDRAFQELVQLRNEVDALEQRVEQARRDMGEEIFARTRFIDRKELDILSTRVLENINQADE